MGIVDATWADLGYRRVGPLPASGGGLAPAEVVGRMTGQSDYEAMPGHWVRRRARRKRRPSPAYIDIAAVFDGESPLEGQDLSFLDLHGDCEWVRAEAGMTRFRAPPEVIGELVADAGAGDPWRRVYRLTQALFYGGPERLRQVFVRHVGPAFFRLYPRGRVVVLRSGTEFDSASALLRVLYAAAQAPLSELNTGDFQGVQTLREWHFGSVGRAVPMLLGVFNHLFYPFVGGACASPPGLDFLFLFDPPEEHTPAVFPGDWLAWPARYASFGREDADPVAIIADPRGPAALREAHQRFLHPGGFTAEERLGLLRWYVGRVNRLLYELTDVANFTERRDPRAPVDPVLAFEHQLTVDRLLRKTLAAMTLGEAPAGNLTAFEVADLYDGLGQRFGNRKNATEPYKLTEFFKALFDTREAPAILAPRLRGLPGPFGDYFAGLATRVYGRLEEAVLGSVWLKSKVTPAGVMVRDKELRAEELMPAGQFVGEVMRAYRNAHHGYFSEDRVSQKRPSRFLFLVNANLPAELSVLPPLWWLAYLADPGLVGWTPLGVGEYD